MDGANEEEKWRRRPERRSKRSALAQRTIPAIVGSSIFQATVLLTSEHGDACHALQSGESERKQRRGRLMGTAQVVLVQDAVA